MSRRDIFSKYLSHPNLDKPGFLCEDREAAIGSIFTGEYNGNTKGAGAGTAGPATAPVLASTGAEMSKHMQ
jgi:hypothetical protein